jgi:phosphatidylglycerophosphate synthase
MNKKLARLWATKNKDDEWWSSFVTSPLAIAVNYAAVDIKWLTPNLITLFSLVTAIISAFFIVVGGSVNFIIAAILIHLSHILDCMDGQMARYRKISSPTGSFFDKLTDHIQITIWFGAVGYAAYTQTQNVLPIFLAFIGIAFHSWHAYTKYVAIYEMSGDSRYKCDNIADIWIKLSKKHIKKEETAGLGYGITANLRWFIGEQKKFFSFNEGVFIFMLSLALIVNELTLMLWIFAISQIANGITRAWQLGLKMQLNKKTKT